MKCNRHFLVTILGHSDIDIMRIVYSSYYSPSYQFHSQFPFNYTAEIGVIFTYYCCGHRIANAVLDDTMM